MKMGPANHLSVLQKRSPQPPSSLGRKHLPKHTAPGEKHPQSAGFGASSQGSVVSSAQIFPQCSNTAMLSGKVSFHPADVTLSQQKYFHGVALNHVRVQTLRNAKVNAFFQAPGANHYAQSADRLLQASSSSF